MNTQDTYIYNEYNKKYTQNTTNIHNKVHRYIIKTQE